MAYTQDAGRGPMQKTGRGIPESFKSPATQKAKQYDPRIQAQLDIKKTNDSLAVVKKKRAEALANVAYEGEQNQIREAAEKRIAAKKETAVGYVKDSLKLVNADREAEASKKYGNLARGEHRRKKAIKAGRTHVPAVGENVGLSLDASEDPALTRNLSRSYLPKSKF